MPEEKIVTEKAGEEDHKGSTNIEETPAYTRRDFLQKAVVVASGLAISSQLPASFTEALAAAPQAPNCTPVAPGQTLLPIMEITSSGPDPTKPRTLKAVLKVLDEEKVYLGQPGSGSTNLSCNTGRMRYFSGYDASVPPTQRKVWPTKRGVPTTGPTLRASVGDTVQITLLNHVDVKKFPQNQLDNAENGKVCDSNTVFGTGNTYPGDPSFETLPNCFHASSSTNLHFHGTHVSPSGISDNVLITVRPSPRGPDNQPLVNEQTVAAIFNEIFAKCEHGHQPALWEDWPAEWQSLQQKLLIQYDNTSAWLDKSPPPGGQGPSVLPPEEQLWLTNKEQIDQHEFPQYYVGAFPNCFTIPKWNGRPDSMGQAPGTHWYHAHKHGSTALNLANGMAGALIIEGDYDATLDAYYRKKGQKLEDKVLVLQQFSAVLGLLRAIGTKDLVHVNGQYTPVLEMRPNQTQLWRIINACHQQQVPLNAPTGIKWVQTAQDGVQLHQLNYNPDPNAETNKTFPVPARAIETAEGWVSSGSLAAGNRIDLLVQAPSTAGNYPVTFADGSKTVLLLTVKVTGTAMSAVPFPSQAEFPRMPGFLSDIRPPIGMVTREIRFNTTKTQLPGPSPTPIPQGTVGGRNPNPAPTPLFPNAPPTHTINGKQFSHEVDQHMKLGATEEWNLFNDTIKGGPAHPFHIHVNPFQVIALFDPARMDESKRATGVPLKRPWVWWDDFAIPPGGWAKMWTRFVDYTGTYVFHCHILGHEDRGMMQLVEVYPARTPMKHK